MWLLKVSRVCLFFFFCVQKEQDGLIQRRPVLVFINSVERGHMLHDIIAPLLASRNVHVGIYTSKLRAMERAENLNRFKVCS
jgi:superfamily II DNA/RNA helicase